MSGAARGIGSEMVSPGLRRMMRRRAADLTALALALCGVGLLLALLSYDPVDPSLDTATASLPRNLAGLGGAALSDALLQGFGLAGALPGLALLTWAWRLAARRGIGGVGGRVIAMLLGLPVLAGALAMAGTGLAWPAGAGPGGAAGVLVGGAALAAGRGVLGPPGGIATGAALTVLALLLSLLAMGLTRAELRLAGRAGRSAASLSWRGGRGAVSLAGRATRGWGGREGGALDPAGQDDPAVAAERAEAEARAADMRVMPPITSPRMDAEAGPPVRARAASKPSPASRQARLPLDEAGWRAPPLSLLKAAPARVAGAPTEEALQGNARLLETVLSDYGVQGAIQEIRPGPVVTLYEFEPAPGVRSARVIGLADDVARSLSVTAVRIATVPGRNVIGIEVPNQKREIVYLGELLGAEAWARQGGRLPLALGKDIGGGPVVADLSRMPHLMIAGTTGSGKSVGVNAMILSLLYALSPDQCRLILIDPKMLELSTYEGIPHLMAPVVTEPKKAVVALKWTVREMERRYRAMSQLGVRNIGGYNDRVADARAKGELITRRVQTGFDPETGRPIFEEQPLALDLLPFIVVVVDEMADLMMVAGKEIEAAVQRLAQMARAAGIHVVMATQRPSVDVITGTIKANFPTRISFQVISKFDSRTILGEQGAEQLLGQGDMLFMIGGGRITRVHGPFVADGEVEEVVRFLRAQGEPAYVEAITEIDDETADGGSVAELGEGEKGLLDQAIALVAREGRASTSFIQRGLQIGYNRAAKLIEQMEREGVVGPANHVGKREVLVRRTREEE